MIYEGPLFQCLQREPYGKILHRLRVMNGFAGLRPAKKMKLGVSVSRRHSQNLEVEYAGLVAGLVARTAQNKFMTSYKHTQIGYLMLVVTLAVLVLFAWAQITARAEPSSYYSGTNFLITAIMALILIILASFVTLRVSIDENYLRIKFGYGIFKKKFPMSELVSVKAVKNRWYYGWGIRVWFWPYKWIYNISGFSAVEIIMKNQKIYRIGTDEPEKLETAIKQAINS